MDVDESTLVGEWDDEDETEGTLPEDDIEPEEIVEEDDDI